VPRRPRLTWLAVTGACLLAIAVAALALSRAPTDEYLFEPGSTRNVDAMVEVQGEPSPAATEPNGAGLYMVDIAVSRASVLQRLLPFLRKDGTLVPVEAFNPEGLSDEQKGKADLLLMSRSQQAAEAVGLRALGCDVDIEPSGAEVALVLPGSPAATAGLEPGDLIVEVDGAAVDGPDDLRDVLAGVEPGDSVTVTYERDGKPVEVRVGTRGAGDDPDRAVMGVQVDQGANVDLPVEVTIDAKGVGGPSAGLVFALGIVDELGPDVDQGRKVVATGELTLDGTVLPIGGIKQKTIAALEDGADLFVVPVDNATEARRYADGLPIIPVRTFTEAVNALGVSAEELAAGCPV